MVYWFTRIATWLAARTPRAVRTSVAGALAVLVYYAWAAKRRVTIANMAQILGTTPDDPRAARLARSSWRNYGRYAADFLHLSGRGEQGTAEVLADLDDTTPPPGAFGQVDAAHARGKGVLIATAHFGNWDVAGMLTASHTPLHVLVERFADQRLDLLVQAQRAALGMNVLWMEKSPRQILRVLQQGGAVAIVIDRPLPAGEGVPVTFFGRRCYVPGGVAQLALLSGATILPGFVYYSDNESPRFHARVLPLIIPESTGDRKADTVRLTQRIYDALEEMIRPFPDQWYMFRPFWPEQTASAGEAIETAMDTAIETAGASAARGVSRGAASEASEAGRQPSRVTEPAEQGERDG